MTGHSFIPSMFQLGRLFEPSWSQPSFYSIGFVLSIKLQGLSLVNQ